MRFGQWATGLGLLTVLAVGSGAQDTVPEKKPGGLNKVARNVSNASRIAGKQVKSNLKAASSDAHQVLTKAGNDTKAEAKRATGYTAPPPDQKPGGLNKLARDISHASKKTGAEWKQSVKGGASSTHGALTDAGKAAKDTLRNVKPPL